MKKFLLIVFLLLVAAPSYAQTRYLKKDTDDVMCYANTDEDGSGTDTIPITDADGHLQVDVLSTTGGGSGGTSSVDDSAFTAGTDSGTPAMGFFSTDTVNSGDVGVLAMDASRRLLVSIEADNAGIGGGTQYTEDDAAASNPTGNAQILVADSTPGLEVVDGDNVARRATRYGAAYTQIVDSSGSFIDTFGGGTQYTEGDTDATFTGTMCLAEGPSDTATVLQVDASDHLQVDIAADSAGLATAANQLADGHNVTVDNAGGASAVNVQDGGNSITVDGSVSISGTPTVDTELPAAAALADNTSNPTVPGVGSFLHGWDGATWDRLPGTSADGLLCNLGSNNDVTVAGVATAANQLADGHNVTVDNALGASAVNIQDGGNTITVDGTVAATQSGTWNINNISGTVSLPTGAATAANQLADGHNVTVDNASGASAVNIQDGGNTITVDGTVTANLSATDNAVLDNIDTNTGNTDTNTTDLPNVIGTDGAAGPSRALSIAGTESGGTLQELLSDSDGHLQVDVLSGGGSATNPGTSVVSSVNDSASNQTLLSSNGDRLGAIIFNDSTQTLYVKFGTTATTSDYSVKIYPDEGYALDPPVYTGQIDGIWAADGSGAARVTELD